MFHISRLHFTLRYKLYELTAAYSSFTLIKKVLSQVLLSISGGPMIDYNRKLIEKFKRHDNRLCFFHNRLSRKN